MVRGDFPFHLKLALKVTHFLRPIFSHYVSTVRASEKSSIIANRKSTKRFLTSYIELRIRYPRVPQKVARCKARVRLPIRVFIAGFYG